MPQNVPVQIVLIKNAVFHISGNWGSRCNLRKQGRSGIGSVRRNYFTTCILSYDYLIYIPVSASVWLLVVVYVPCAEKIDGTVVVVILSVTMATPGGCSLTVTSAATI